MMRPAIFKAEEFPHFANLGKFRQLCIQAEQASQPCIPEYPSQLVSLPSLFSHEFRPYVLLKSSNPLWFDCLLENDSKTRGRS